MLQLREMEIERISDFAYKGKGTIRRKEKTGKTAESTAGDLISSIKTSSSEQVQI